MDKSLISKRLFCILSGLAGATGVVLLGLSFAINSGPPPGATHAELILRSGFLLRELSKPPHELLLSLSRERIYFASLSTPSGRTPLANPTAVHKSFEQGIHKVVVHLSHAEDSPGAFF